MSNILLLGSKSPSRQLLLKEAHIPFTIISQDADESQCDWGLPLQQLVESITLHKMEHIVLPQGKKEGERCFVLTADTMSQDSTGKIHGKPIDREDAITKIKAARAGNRLVSSFCLDRKIYRDGEWHVDQRIHQSVNSEYKINIPDEWIDIYLEKSLGLFCSGAIQVEGFGTQFLLETHGSYSNIVGLPMFEVRQALGQVGFFS